MATQHKRPGRTAKTERKRRVESRPHKAVVVWLRGKDMDNISPGKLVAVGEIMEVAV